MTDESGEKRSLNERFYRSVQFTAGPLIVNHLFISSIRHSYHLPHQTPSAPISQSCSLLYFHLNCSASIACQWVEADLVIPITSIEISSNRELTTDYYCDSLLPLLPHLLPHPPALPRSIHWWLITIERKDWVQWVQRVQWDLRSTCHQLNSPEPLLSSVALLLTDWLTAKEFATCSTLGGGDVWWLTSVTPVQHTRHEGVRGTHCCNSQRTLWVMWVTVQSLHCGSSGRSQLTAHCGIVWSGRCTVQSLYSHCTVTVQSPRHTVESQLSRYNTKGTISRYLSIIAIYSPTVSQSHSRTSYIYHLLHSFISHFFTYFEVTFSLQYRQLGQLTKTLN